MCRDDRTTEVRAVDLVSLIIGSDESWRLLLFGPWPSLRVGRSRLLPRREKPSWRSGPTITASPACGRLRSQQLQATPPAIAALCFGHCTAQALDFAKRRRSGHDRHPLQRAGRAGCIRRPLSRSPPTSRGCKRILAPSRGFAGGRHEDLAGVRVRSCNPAQHDSHRGVLAGLVLARTIITPNKKEKEDDQQIRG
jgi:hypothetical protein